jgi:tetratricopeptide (TPR) repeat protein
MDRKIVKYNPAFLTDQELIDGFVVRLTEYELILEIVRENTSESNQHVLVIGPRGSGKTTLVRRVAAEIRRDENLKKQWYPIIFGEESYMVSTPGEFWLEAIFHLGFQTKDKKWKRLYEELKEENDEERLREKALAQLLDFADGEGKRLMLVVENLHQLLGDQISDEDAWVLRKTLLHERRIMLLGTSVGPFWTGQFEEVESEGKAMFELFKKIELASLTDIQCKILWKSITGKDVESYCIRPINILTGGNPRLVMIISRFGADLSFKNLLEDLLKLVDENTEYFKSHLDNLSAQERKVYLSLAEIWDPATAKQVSQQARLAVNTTSTILGRLETRGAVTVVTQEGRKRFYQIAERMYNIYHLMRRRGGASGRVKAAVQFIASFYDAGGIIQILKAIANEACKIDSAKRVEHCSAFSELLFRLKDTKLREQLISEIPSDFLSLPELHKELINNIKFPSTHVDTITQQSTKKALDLFFDGLKNSDTKKLEAAHDIIENMLKENPEVNPFLVLGAVIEEELGHYEKAISLYEKFLENEPEEKFILSRYGNLLNKKLHDYKKAENIYKKLISIDGKYIKAYAGLADVYFMQQSFDKAIHVCNQMVEMLPDEVFTYGMRGIIYTCLEKEKEAIRDFRKAIELDPDSKDLYCNLIYSLLFDEQFDAAIKEIMFVLDDVDFVKKEIDSITEFFVILASKGLAKKASEILDKYESKKLLEPLVVGLKMYLGQDVRVAEEIKEVAKDVVKRIEEAKVEKNSE